MMAIREAINNQQGLATSLIEATLVIAIAAILTSVALVTATDQTEDANFSAAQAEVKLVGLSILSFMQDTGFVPAFQQGTLRRSSDPIYAVLESEGTDPDDAHGEWKLGAHDLLENHLVRNGPGGHSDDASYGYPRKGSVRDGQGELVNRLRGWNGPYMSQVPAGDPWGDKYLANVGFLTPQGVELAQTAFGLPPDRRPAVFVISAGENRSIETRLAQPADEFVAGGDDLIFRIQ